MATRSFPLTTNPFAADGVAQIQQAQIQQPPTSTQPAQPQPQTQPQQPVTGAGLPGVNGPATGKNSSLRVSNMSEYNERQYRLMLAQLQRFEEGQTKLDALVDGLEGLLDSLEDISNSWRQAFLQEWGKLEDERAYALSENLKAFDQETSQRLRLAASRLKLLILKNIDDPIDRGRSSP